MSGLLADRIRDKMFAFWTVPGGNEGRDGVLWFARYGLPLGWPVRPIAGAVFLCDSGPGAAIPRLYTAKADCELDLVEAVCGGESRSTGEKYELPAKFAVPGDWAFTLVLSCGSIRVCIEPCGPLLPVVDLDLRLVLEAFLLILNSELPYVVPDILSSSSSS